jgi:hypothetical protein
MTVQKILLVIAVVIFSIIAIMDRSLLAAGLAFFAAAFVF